MNRYDLNSTCPLTRLEIRARLGYFEVFFSSLSKDPWVMSSIRKEFQIDFSSTQFQTIARSNMHMGKGQTEICDWAIMALLEKNAIEPVKPLRRVSSTVFPSS